jgi:predicted HAD superfamily hydrolase
MTPARESFDVFDTALTRSVARPTDVFIELGARLGAADPVRWMRRRVEAERRARRGAAGEDTTLEDIHTHLARALNWTAEETRRAMAAELDLERSGLRPVPEIRARIQALHRDGRPVVFLSDMYLPAAFLQAALEEHGFWREGDELLVSSAVGATKRTGNLYRVARERTGLRPGNWRHTGDDPQADVRAARDAGLEAVPFVRAQLNRHERAGAGDSRLPAMLRSRVAAASRLARLSRTAFEDPEQQTVWDTGTSVIGPVLTGYAAWCLAEAQRRGIRTLFFVRRDGQILRRLAEALCRSWGLGIECRDLYGSRQAWHLPALSALDDSAFDWLFADALHRSVDVILRRAGLDAAQAGPVLAAGGFPAETWRRPLDGAQLAHLKELLARDPLHGAILAEAAERRRTAIGYLRQEGLADLPDWALVDMGWSGRMQRSLQALLRAAGSDRPLCGFYFALYGGRVPGDGDRLDAYLDSAWFACKGLRHVPVLETLAAADHGSVVAYREEPGVGFAPVFHDRPPEARQAPRVRLQQEAAEAFAREFARLVPADEVRPEAMRRIAVRLLDGFCGAPTPEEALAYGRFRAAEEQTGGRLWRLAVRIRPRHYWAAVLRGGRALYRLRWPEGCIAASLGHPRARIALLHARQALGAWKNRPPFPPPP